MKNRIKTCIIGSYPIQIDTFKLMINYYNQENVRHENPGIPYTYFKGWYS